jgi:hypothetical protein
LYFSCTKNILIMYYSCMSNKHDSFESYILERLTQGALKSHISRELVERGCASTPDQLSRWIKRRADRIASRIHLIDPMRTPVPVPAQVVPASTPHLSPQPEPEPTHQGAPAQAPSKIPGPLDFMKKGTFNFEIPSEEEIDAQQHESSKIRITKK